MNKDIKNLSVLEKNKRNCYKIFILLQIFLFAIVPLSLPMVAVYIVVAINFIYFINNFAKIFLFFYGGFKYKYCDYFKSINFKISVEDLPIYSILLPARKEKEIVLKNLLQSIHNFDYPIEKIDIKLIIDADDFGTIKIAKSLKNDYNFELIEVPDGVIKSKPMSLNYALKFIKGEFLTIYDAEDRPEKYQLRKAVEKFSELSEDYICLQAPLNYYNKYSNFISYCFSIEYSMWFDFTLRALSKLKTFFPLGGTSNHFRANKLLEIGGWDGYNVTEDAELGVRISKAGYKMSFLESITEEECPTQIFAWYKQRTRWIKGFMQTFCEHIASNDLNAVETNVKFKSIFKIGLLNIFIFFIFIIMSFFFFTSLATIMFSYIILKFYDINFSSGHIVYLNLITSLIMTYISFIIVIIKNKMKFNFLYFIFFPFYWIMHYFAAFGALKSLIISPFFWAKTDHGVDKNYLFNISNTCCYEKNK